MAETWAWGAAGRGERGEGLRGIECSGGGDRWMTMCVRARYAGSVRRLGSLGGRAYLLSPTVAGGWDAGVPEDAGSGCW